MTILPYLSLCVQNINILLVLHYPRSQTASGYLCPIILTSPCTKQNLADNLQGFCPIRKVEIEPYDIAKIVVLPSASSDTTHTSYLLDAKYININTHVNNFLFCNDFTTFLCDVRYKNLRII